MKRTNDDKIIEGFIRVNSLTLSGTCKCKPTVNENKKYACFTLFFSNIGQIKRGELQQIDVFAFDEKCINIIKEIRSGDKVFVIGKINRYKNAQKKYEYNVIAYHIEWQRVLKDSVKFDAVEVLGDNQIDYDDL